MKSVIFLFLMALLTFIPYGMQRYDVVATHLARVKPFVFGVRVRDVPPELREQTGGKGVTVDAVVKDSMAFRDRVLSQLQRRQPAQVKGVTTQGFPGIVRSTEESRE